MGGFEKLAIFWADSSGKIGSVVSWELIRRTAEELVDLPSEADIYQYVAEKVAELVPYPPQCFVESFDEVNRQFFMRAMVSHDFRKSGAQIVGLDVVCMAFPIEEFFFKAPFFETIATFRPLREYHFKPFFEDEQYSLYEVCIRQIPKEIYPMNIIRPHYAFLLALMVVLLLPTSVLAADSTLVGSWKLIPEKSTDIDLYSTLSIDIRNDGPRLIVIRTWGAGRSFRDSLSLTVGGEVNRVPVARRVFPSNVFMGLSMVTGSTREIKAYRTGEKEIRLEETFPLRGSQGQTKVTATHLFTLVPERNRLAYEIKRSTRTSGPPVKFVLSRADADDGYGTEKTEAYAFRLEDNWEIDGKLPLQALVWKNISLKSANTLAL
jgi:hypothetical protein